MKTTKSRTPFFRSRKQKSGLTYYYLEIPGANTRSEVALGNVRQDALKMRQELLFKYRTENRTEPSDLIFWLSLYKEILVPMLAPLARHENHASIEKLMTFFNGREFGWKDIENPGLMETYSQWRNPKFSLRIKGELSLLKRVRRELDKLNSQASR